MMCFIWVFSCWFRLNPGSVEWFVFLYIFIYIQFLYVYIYIESEGRYPTDVFYMSIIMLFASALNQWNRILM